MDHFCWGLLNFQINRRLGSLGRLNPRSVYISRGHDRRRHSRLGLVDFFIGDLCLLLCLAEVLRGEFLEDVMIGVQVAEQVISGLVILRGQLLASGPLPLECHRVTIGRTHAHAHVIAATKLCGLHLHHVV